MSFENVGQGKFSFLAKPHVLRDEAEYDIAIATLDDDRDISSTVFI